MIAVQDLAREARKQCKVLVSSIFVNPAQFAAHEDLGTYPRTEEQDLRYSVPRPCAQARAVL